MAIYANLSTITAQTIPLIIINPATVAENQLLLWDSSLGSFVARTFTIPENSRIIFSELDIIEPLSVAHGGTGNTSFESNEILVGNNNSISTIPYGIPNNSQVLSIQNGNIQWQDISKVKNNNCHISYNLNIESSIISNAIHTNTYVTQISIIINDVYNESTELSIVFNDETIIDSNIINLQNDGVYIYRTDKQVNEETTVFFVLNNASFGSCKIIIDFIQL